MKLSKREKILLGLLIASIIVFGVYKFIYNPIVNRITVLKEELKESESKEKTVSELLINELKIKEQLNILSEKIENNKNIYVELKQEQIIVLLKDLLSRSNMNAYTLSFTVPEDVILLETIIENDLSDINTLLSDVTKKINIIKGISINNKEDNESNKEIKYQKMLVTIQFESTYNSFISFINSIENNREKILVNNINVSKDEDILSGTIILEFNAISF